MEVPLKYSTSGVVHKPPFKMYDGETPSHYGALKFIGYNRPNAPFICVSQTTEISSFTKYVYDKWKLEPPRVILSVTGGAQAFQMKPRLESMFSQGLGDAARSTNAWIVTGGTDTGVMEFVGKAVRLQDSKIVTLGIAPLWRVTHSDTFHVYDQTVMYKKRKENSGDSAALEPNHSHFVFVEDEKRFWGGEIPFRSAFEKELSEKIPIVLIVVQGGPGTLKTVDLAVTYRFPVILVEGSGGAADAIGTYWHKSNNRPAQYEEVLEAPLWQNPNHIATLNNICEQDKEAKCIRTFALETDSTKSIDSTILRAILEDKNRSLTLEDKFLLAVEWHRPDFLSELLDISHQTDSTADRGEIAREFDNSLNSALQVALEKGFEDVVTLLIQNNAKIESIDLPKLYNCIRFLREGLHSVSTPKRNKHAIPPFALALLGKNIRLNEYVKSFEVTVNQRKTSITDLLIWSVLSNRVALAEVLWLHDPYPIHSALMASSLFHSVSQFNKTYREGGDLFEEKAVGVLTQFHSYNEAKSALLEGWHFLGKASCNPMRLAVESNLKRFASHPYCQIFIEKILSQSNRKKIRTNTPTTSLVGRSLVPFPYYLQHKRLVTDVHKKTKGQEQAENTTNAIMGSVLFGSDDLSKLPKERDMKKASVGDFVKEASVFYDIPRVKFITNALFYALFLILVSAVAISKPVRELSILDWLELVWVSGLLIDEFEQYYHTSKSDYFATSTNRADIVMFSVWSLYYGFRFAAAYVSDDSLGNDLLDYSASIYIVVTVVCYLRGIQILSVNYVMGPFLLMIQKMFDDFVRFGVMTVALLVGFQIAFMALARWELRDTNQFPEDEYDGDEWHVEYPVGIGYLAFWALIGEFSDAFTYYENSFFALILLLAYLVLAQVLLINLLIAMMADTYSEVRTNADKEWKFNQAFLLSQYVAANPVPPPLNLVALILRGIACQSCDVIAIHEEAIDTESLRTKVQDMRSSYLEEVERTEKQNIEYKISCLEERLQDMEISQQEDRELLEEHFNVLEKLINSVSRTTENN